MSTTVIVVINSKNKNIKVRVGPDYVAEAPAQYTKGMFDAYYLGGLPQSLREKCATLSTP